MTSDTFVSYSSRACDCHQMLMQIHKLRYTGRYIIRYTETYTHKHDMKTKQTYHFGLHNGR